MSDDKPETKKVLARDVVPYEWALWCRFSDDDTYGRKPIANAIEHVKWSEDGQHLWFMLATHNFYKAAPDDVLDLIPCKQNMGDEFQARIRKEHAEMIASRPVPVTQCAECKGTGRVPIVRVSAKAIREEK